MAMPEWADGVRATSWHIFVLPRAAGLPELLWGDIYAADALRVDAAHLARITKYICLPTRSWSRDGAFKFGHKALICDYVTSFSRRGGEEPAPVRS
jgi:hypothetical protein